MSPRRRTAFRLAGLAVLGGLAALGQGCASDPTRGYAFGAAFDDSIDSVAVPIFDNSTFTGGLEVTLTDAVVKEIQASTPWRVTNRDLADTVLTGVITDIDFRALSRNPTIGFVQEQLISITVDFTWRDNRTGEALVERRGFTAATSLIASRATDGTIGERPEIGQRDALDELSRTIVEQLRSRW